MSQQILLSDERNVLIVIALLKAHGIRKIIASPGTTNIAFVGSVQNDPYFEVYSAVDERHAAYMACGLSTESGEPVVLSCTGATASRNYFPALTEAYYRQLPILAVTSMADFSRAGNFCPQWIERGVFPRDAIKLSVSCPVVKSDADARSCELNINRAILELTRRGGGPVHINLETLNTGNFHTASLPAVRKINRTVAWSETWPEIPHGKIAVWISSHKPMSPKLQELLEKFVEAHDAVVLVDCTSSYCGKGAVSASVLTAQGMGRNKKYQTLTPSLIVHIGGVSGDYQTRGYLFGRAPVWRVGEDGELVDSLGCLTHVFEMAEPVFFAHYVDKTNVRPLLYAEQWQHAVDDIKKRIPSLPFSNLWIAKEFANRIPAASVVHCAILSSLRCFNFMCDDKSLSLMSNVGGFGIDGNLSTLIGASLADVNRLHFIMIGDMSFFYDMNALGNRHIGRNVRVLLVNNGMSGEMYMPISIGSKLGSAAKEYVCSSGHFGGQSRSLIREYSRSLGFRYLKAESEREFMEALPAFTSAEVSDPMLLECFTNPENEYKALNQIINIEKCPEDSIKRMAKIVLPNSVQGVVRKAMCKLRDK